MPFVRLAGTKVTGTQLCKQGTVLWKAWLILEPGHGVRGN